MSNIKLSLTITLPGSVMVSKAEVLKPLREKGKIRYVEDWDKMDANAIELYNPKKQRKEKLLFHTRPFKTASQSIQITEEAYNNFVSAYVPEWEKKGDWTRMSKKQRLESHLKRICQHLGGTEYSYEVFED